MKEWKREEVNLNPRLAGQVLRYHVWPTLRQQSVGEHVWQVMRIYVEIFGVPQDNALYHILHHDSGEIITGDLPFPVKRDNPTLKKIFDDMEDATTDAMKIETFFVSKVLKWSFRICDLMEMLEFGLQEEQMGNKLAHPIVVETAATIRRMCEDPPEDLPGRTITIIKQRLMDTISFWTGERGHVV